MRKDQVRNCVRPGVKNKDGPGWRESRGESALENKIQCSLWKDRVHRAGDTSSLSVSISSRDRFCHYLELCKITHTERSTVREGHSQDTGFHLDSNFPQRKWVFRSGTRAGSSARCDAALGPDPTDPSKSHCHKKQKKDFRIHQLCPAAQVNDLQTTWSSYQPRLGQQGSCQPSHACLQYEQDCGSRKRVQS